LIALGMGVTVSDEPPRADLNSYHRVLDRQVFAAMPSD
jgi:hypothetical protein